MSKSIIRPRQPGSKVLPRAYKLANWRRSKPARMLKRRTRSSTPKTMGLGTTEADRLRHDYRWEIPSASTDSPNSAVRNSSLRQVFLQDWWLIKADSDSHGRKLGIGGFTSKENRGIRSFATASIIQRIDAVTFVTVDSIVVMVQGHLNRLHTLENGFPREVCDHFVIGFPYYWEEFSTLPFEGKDASSSTYKTPPRRDASSRDIFDEMLCQSTGNVESCQNQEDSQQVKTVIPDCDETPQNHKKTKANQKMQHTGIEVQRSGPLTRSRTRLRMYPDG